MGEKAPPGIERILNKKFIIRYTDFLTALVLYHVDQGYKIVSEVKTQDARWAAFVYAEKNGARKCLLETAYEHPSAEWAQAHAGRLCDALAGTPSDAVDSVFAKCVVAAAHQKHWFESEDPYSEEHKFILRGEGPVAKA